MADPGDGHTLGWLGTGRMGVALVHRLLRARRDVAVFNRTRAKAEPLGAEGATIADHAAELGSADIVFVMVGTSQDLIDAVTGPDGLISGGRAPSVVVDCSTVSSEASEQVRQVLAGHGCALLAAPVMGNPKVAEVGKLTFAVSGSRAAFELARPPRPARRGGHLCRRGRGGKDRQAVSQSGTRRRDAVARRGHRARREERHQQAGAACLPQQQRHGLDVQHVQDAGLRQPRLPPDLYLVSAAQGLRPWPGRRRGSTRCRCRSRRPCTSWCRAWSASTDSATTTSPLCWCFRPGRPA